MGNVDTSKPVVVTGATGYVAGALVSELLDLGFTIHAGVRDPDNQDKLQYLDQLAAEKAGKIKYFKADLLAVGSYLPAMVGAETVFHTASPFTLDVNDPQRDLVDPAVKGTLNVLESVNQAESVKRVVLTSSVAAMACDNIEVAQSPKGKITEDDWNEYASLNHSPYHFSKVEAEKAAWSCVEQQSRWDLVVINPSLVVGPALNPNATSDSFHLIKQYADGTLKWGAPKCGIGLVDVNDVAHAHVQAAFVKLASGRYIVSGKNSSLMDIADMLRDNYGEKYPLPTAYAPKLIAWILAPLVNTKREFVSRNFGYLWFADNRKSISDLSIEYSDVKVAINAMFKQLVNRNRSKK